MTELTGMQKLHHPSPIPSSAFILPPTLFSIIHKQTPPFPLHSHSHNNRSDTVHSSSSKVIVPSLSDTIASKQYLTKSKPSKSNGNCVIYTAVCTLQDSNRTHTTITPLLLIIITSNREAKSKHSSAARKIKSSQSEQASKRGMRAMLLQHLLLLVFFSAMISLTQLSALPALPALPQPDAAPIPVNSGALGAANQATIPAFPEQSDAASSSCQLDLPADLLPSVSAACSVSGKAGRSHLPSRASCCPVLAAWLYAGYSATSLAARPVSSSAAAAGLDLPALPDDSESCVARAESALRSRGLALPRLNGTCDAAYCYCGVRLRRLTCAGGAFVVDTAQGRWVPARAAGRRLERDCARSGLAGCNRCIRSLNKLKVKEKKEDANDAAVSERRRRGSGVHDRECQLMGVTWLLFKNRTKYLPAATSVLRVLMAADEVGSSDPSSCALSRDEMPLAVGSSQINGADGLSTLRPSLSSSLFLVLSLALSFLRSMCL